MKKKVICANCTTEFDKHTYEIKKTSNDFCSRSCAATYNNKKYPKRKPSWPRNGVCINCATIFKFIRKNPQKKYCNNKCQSSYNQKMYIKRWLIGKETGNQGQGRGLLTSGYVRRWLFDTRGEKCENCGWYKVNPASGKAPLEIHHVDGNAENTIPSNLKILCPNCHSLTPTYRSLNNGNSRRV